MHHIDYKYVLLAGSRTDGFKETANQVFACRCPYCGDSKKHSRKTRGFFIPKDETYRFYCHNCGKSCFLVTYLKEQADDLFSAYKLDKFGSYANGTREITEIDVPTPKFTETDKLLKKCTVLNRCVGELLEVKRYAESRKLPVERFSSLYAISDINIITSVLPRYHEIHFPKCKMLLIPFFNKKREYNYVQCRVADGSITSDMRFVTLQINEGHKIYGEEYVDYSAPVYVLEGPIDSMHITNALAVGGVSTSLKHIEQQITMTAPKENLCVLMDNDYRFNSQVRDKLVKAMRAGYSVVLFDDRFRKIKDINQAVAKEGWSVRDVNTYIRERTFHGLRAELEYTFQMKKSS